MGLFDKIFGKKDAGAADAPTKSFSQHMRDAGLNPDGLKFAIASDGMLTVTGDVSGDFDRVKMAQVLSGIAGVNSVNDQTSLEAAEEAVGDAGGADNEVVVEASGEATEADVDDSGDNTADEGDGAEAASDAAGRSYTVQSGDTLWKISQAMYGDGSKYMKIFEANTSILDNPDRIFPGQELAIPDLEE